jgi:hypothetical protein
LLEFPNRQTAHVCQTDVEKLFKEEVAAAATVVGA